MFSMPHFDEGFDHVKSVQEIHAKAGNNGAEATPSRSSLDMLDCADSNTGFLNVVITGDELWVYGYDPIVTMETFIIPYVA